MQISADALNHIRQLVEVAKTRDTPRVRSALKSAKALLAAQRPDVEKAKNRLLSTGKPFHAALARYLTEVAAGRKPTSSEADELRNHFREHVIDEAKGARNKAAVIKRYLGLAKRFGVAESTMQSWVYGDKAPKIAAKKAKAAEPISAEEQKITDDYVRQFTALFSRPLPRLVPDDKEPWRGTPESHAAIDDFKKNLRYNADALKSKMMADKRLNRDAFIRVANAMYKGYLSTWNTKGGYMPSRDLITNKSTAKKSVARSLFRPVDHILDSLMRHQAIEYRSAA